MLTVVTFVAFAVLIYAVRHQIIDSFRNLGRVNTMAILLLLPVRAYNYHVYTRLYQEFFKILGEKVNYKRMMRVHAELTFVNNVFPSGGVSGFSFFGVRMRKEGVSAGKATLVQFMRFILIFVSFQAFLVIGLIILAIGGKASNFIMLVAGSLSTLLIISTLAFAFIIGSKKRINAFFTYITHTLNRLIGIVRRNVPETISVERVQNMFNELHENYMLIKDDLWRLKWPMVYAMLVNLSEILAIYVIYVAFGELVNPGAVIIAYAIANFAGFFSVLPGGVGIYEALMTGVLAAAGIPPGVSIPVTVMYRILSMLIQLPLGYVLYEKTIHAKDAPQELSHER